MLAQGLPGLPPRSGPHSQLDAAPQPVDLSQMVADIVSRGQPAARDYRDLAEATLQTGAAFKAAGQPLADSVIKDGIRATEEGRELAPGAYPWQELSERLKELLQEPPPQDQPQQNQQGQDQQNPQDQQSEQDQQGGEGNSGQEGQPSEQGERPQDQQGGQDQSGESQSGEEEQQGEERQPQQQAQGDRLGDMDTEGEEDIRLDQEPPQPQPTQMVGGRQQPDQPLTPDQALRLQQLEKVKQQDDPGKFFQILQQAEQGEEEKQASGSVPAAKDW